MKNQMQNYNEKLTILMTEYYKNYYLNILGLPDYRDRINGRLNEEKLFARPNIEVLQRIIKLPANENIKVLVLGGGTGAEFVVFSQLGFDTYVVEPDDNAIEIIRLKCDITELNKQRVFKCAGESLPFKDSFFDLVFCHTVIEHVQDVEQVIYEAVRVVKTNGYLYFTAPDYRQFYEAHYKLHLPLFFPKFFTKLLLKLYRRPTRFLDTLNFVTAKQMRNLFRVNGVTAMQIYYPYTNTGDNNSSWVKIIRFVQDHLGIERNQYWLLIKQ